MIQYQTSRFEETELAELLGKVEARKDAGHEFVQLCASTKETSCEMLYSFVDPNRPVNEPGIDNLVVDVPDGTAVPSITRFFPAAFVFENEAHDLFGIDIEGINIDFGGNFYTVNVAYPMNPRAAEQQAKATEEVNNG